MNKILKNTKDVVKRMDEIINENEPSQAKTTLPNALEGMKARAELNRIRNERV